jgi:hypothetical protein
MSSKKEEEQPVDQVKNKVKNLEAEIIKESKKIIEDIMKNMGGVKKLLFWVKKFFISGPRSGVYHDWLVVYSFYKKALYRACIKGQQPVTEEEMAALAIIRAYLELARYERDFAQAWSFVNMAAAQLPLVVEEKDLPPFVFYLKSVKENETVEEISQLDKNTLQHKLLERAHQWNVKNRRTSLKLSLWKSVGAWLFLSLAIAVVIAEYTTAMFKGGSTFLYRYVSISLLGFFGGGLSAFFTSRQAAVNIPNNVIIRAHTVLRMLLGAAGSFVVYVAAQWVPLAGISELINKEYAAFLTLGIVAGFSERFFIGALEKISHNLSFDLKDDETGKTNDKPEEESEPDKIKDIKR